jgi:DNA repair protein RadA/Sms
MKSKTKDLKFQGWICSNCGFESITHLGKCPSCHSWNTLEKQTISQAVKKSVKSNGAFSIDKSGGRCIALADIIENTDIDRLSSGFEELDSVLGGGLQKGALVLIGGDPGIGKSTLLLQVAGFACAKNNKVLYVSGEESLGQIKNRANRLSINNSLLLMAETSLDSILDEVDTQKPDLLIVDSIQSIHLDDRDSLPGSMSQIKDCATGLMTLAKRENITTIVIGHITKEGNIAGPKLLEHMVDVVLYFEGDKQNQFRTVRGAKNRFGPTNEIGVFEMSENGLTEITNPSSLFLGDGHSMGELSGSAVTAVLQGNRVLLAEIQSLVGFTPYPQPKRMVNGLDYNRVQQVVAVIERRLGVSLSKHDVYANVIGGLNIMEPSSDLAVAISILGCAKKLFCKERTVFIGELGLAGELRKVAKIDQRLKEAHKLGFQRAIIPSTNLQPEGLIGMEIVQVSNLSEATKKAFA